MTSEPPSNEMRLTRSAILRAALAMAFASAAPSVRAEGPCPSGQSPPLFEEIGTSREAVEAFLAGLKKALAADDRRAVGAMIKYPISAWTGKQSVTFKTAQAFVNSYESIFTPDLKATIAAARTGCLFTNWQGAMIHDGEVWIRADRSGNLKIVTINPPINAGK